MKMRKLLLCVVLLLAFSSSLLCFSAAAENAFAISTGETCNGLIVFEFYTDIADPGLDKASGSFAPGLIYDYSSGYLTVSGTPTVPGSYRLSGVATDNAGNKEPYSFTIIVENAVVGPGSSAIPVLTPAPGPLPELTKSPTDESVYEGGSAMFIARANDAEYIEWYFVDPVSHSSYTGAQAAQYLKGLRFSGLNEEVLEVYNIPLEMDGWMVECLFSNASGDTLSESAVISVDELELLAPTIKTQPQSAEKDMDSSVILSVIADNNTEGSSLKYQWYICSASGTNLSPISGANSSSYTPARTKGSTHYCVAVWSHIDGKDSSKVYSSPATVSYIEAPVLISPSPAPTATLSPRPSLVPSPSTMPERVPDKDEGGISIIAILLIAMLLSAALAAFIFVILRKNAKEAAAQAIPVRPEISRPVVVPDMDISPNTSKNWLCSCGALNNSAFCTQCGKAKPLPVPSCSNCGWTPESPSAIPHFCPECGTAFEEE